MPCKNSEWINCYKNNTDLWCPDAYCHPAKMSPGLAFRILDHLVELGLLQQGDVILDPMCGIATTLLCSAVRGFKAVGVELETKFKDLAEANKAYLEKKLGHPIDLTILQGDSRNLSTLLSERGLIIVSSPPYAGGSGAGGLNTSPPRPGTRDQTGRCPSSPSQDTNNDYGNTPNQIGNLPEGKVIISSPPYEDSIKNDNKGGIDWLKCAEGPRPDKLRETASHGTMTLTYGQSNNQIGNQNGESYWSAMRQVYAESLKIADVMVLVTKNPTRNKAIHPLGQMTADLITSIGWRIVDWHKAILYDTQEQGDLFGGSKKLYKGRVSFFKRLSLQKGSPAADHEDVIFAVNPNGRRSGIVEVTSPPYQTGTGEGQSLDPLKTTKGTVRGRGFTSLGPTYAQDIGATPGQIGNMPEGRVIISSPPYGDMIDSGAGGIDWDKAGRPDRLTDSPNRHNVYGTKPLRYSSNPDNIGNLRE